MYLLGGLLPPKRVASYTQILTNYRDGRLQDNPKRPFQYRQAGPWRANIPRDRPARKALEKVTPARLGSLN